MPVAHGHSGFGYLGTVSAVWLPHMSSQQASGGSNPTVITTWSIPSRFTSGDLYVRVWAAVFSGRNGAFTASNPGSTRMDLTGQQNSTSLDNQTIVFSGVGPGNVEQYDLSDTSLSWTPGEQFSLLFDPASGGDNVWAFKILYSDNSGFT